MSDSNIEARKGRQCKDHLFMVHGIMNSVIQGKKECIDIQIYDLQQAFDSLWLEDCMIDLTDTIDSDKIALLYESSVNNFVAINTPHGLTQRKPIRSLVQQGGTWGPLKCSNSVDTIGKQVLKNDNVSYLYKGSVKIIPLAMIDDIIAISKCGIGSLTLNTIINSKIELKTLRFHTPDSNGWSKCHKLHVGTHSKACPILQVHGTIIEEVSEDEYLGDILSADGSNRKNVQKRINRGFGIIAEIVNILDQISFGQHYFEIALMLRSSLLLSSILNNVEVIYGLSKVDLAKFDDIDLILMRKLFKAPFSTPKEAFYLELGIIPPSILVKSRRNASLTFIIWSTKTSPKCCPGSFGLRFGISVRMIGSPQ